ncbi:hypothetical protein [Serratia liquefaciens]|nr:hypothetical protein [Serratia liquefaciens]CAI2469808.1 Uncharacterised protein [Serratia liquefaciens]
MSKIVLTQEQIKELARFAAEEGQPSYTITNGITGGLYEGHR